MKFISLVFFLFIFGGYLPAQSGTLYGVIGLDLYQVDHQSAATTLVAKIDAPRGAKLHDLAYHHKEQTFYSFSQNRYSPRLVRFGWDGSFVEIGLLKVNGRPILQCDAIAYNPEDKQLYASITVNGPEAYCGTIVRVNPNSGDCTIIGSMENMGNDADDLIFKDGNLYIGDGIPMVNKLKLFRCTFKEVDKKGLRPTLIKETIYRKLTDFALLNGLLYVPDGKYQLLKYGFDNGDAQAIGITHRPNPAFQEKRMVGLTAVKIVYAK